MPAVAQLPIIANVLTNQKKKNLTMNCNRHYLNKLILHLELLLTIIKGGPGPSVSRFATPEEQGKKMMGWWLAQFRRHFISG